jgi:hypothetical protein
VVVPFWKTNFNRLMDWRIMCLFLWNNNGEQTYLSYIQHPPSMKAHNYPRPQNIHTYNKNTHEYSYIYNIQQHHMRTMKLPKLVTHTIVFFFFKGLFFF